mmetsp:Transcript_62372/g.120167  ORF Transcript_62372/g.120167 Transcript_62372/m.120167 type:complete len:111 (-) Transcript_62372:231-563(-)
MLLTSHAVWSQNFASSCCMSTLTKAWPWPATGHLLVRHNARRQPNPQRRTASSKNVLRQKMLQSGGRATMHEPGEAMLPPDPFTRAVAFAVTFAAAYAHTAETAASAARL